MSLYEWGMSLEEISNGPSSNFSSNPSLTESVLVPTSSSNAIKESNFDYPSRGLFNGSKDGKATITRERKIKSSGLGHFREKLYSEGISKNAADLITGARSQGSITHYKSTWRK